MVNFDLFFPSMFPTLPRPVRNRMMEFIMFFSRKAGIQVCTLEMIENSPPENHSNPRLIARHEEPRMDTST